MKNILQRLWSSWPGQVSGAEVSHPRMRWFWTRDRQLFLTQVRKYWSDCLKNISTSHSFYRSLSGCPRANKPRSRPKDGAEAEPLRWELLILYINFHRQFFQNFYLLSRNSIYVFVYIKSLSMIFSDVASICSPNFEGNAPLNSLNVQ